MTDEPRDCIKVTCGTCGNLVFACVNDPRVLNADRFVEIADLVRYGENNLEHVTTDEIRKSKGCKCKR